MAGSVKQQLWLLIKKNFKVKMNQGIISLFVRTWWPIWVMVAFGTHIHRTEPVPESACSLPGYANPTAGVIPYLQTLICGTNPSCANDTLYEHLPRVEHGSSSTGIISVGGKMMMPCIGQVFERSEKRTEKVLTNSKE